jgi:UDP-N-acetylglucosamine 2-epimerase (non-hydrolysing)
LWQALEESTKLLPLILPAHPRTRAALAVAGISARTGPIHIVEPLGYTENLSLMAGARLVLTDSGGIQEETSVLGIPCLTLRDTTERPATVSLGTNRVIGSRPERVRSEIESVLAAHVPFPVAIPFWDGHTAERIVRAIVKYLE